MSLLEFLADMLHAARVWARDPDRRVVCGTCGCKHKGAHR